MRYVELNSGVVPISISSWMNNLSVYFECVLVLTSVSCSMMILLEVGIYYILVHIVVRSAMLGELLVLLVRTIVRVCLQMYMDCLEKRCMLMIEGYLFEYLLILLEVLGMLSVGTGVDAVD